MKKIIYSISMLVLLLLTGCTKSNLTTISLNELNNKISNKDSFVIYFEGEKNILKDKLETVLTSNNIEGYLIKTAKITEEEKIKLQPVISYEGSEIVFIVNGYDSSILSHIKNTDTTTEEIEARLKDMNFIKK